MDLLLGGLISDTIEYDKIAEAPQDFIDDVFLLAFQYFEGWKNINRYIISPDERPQVLATSWILSLLDFRCLYLGGVSKNDENILENKNWRYSADMLATRSDGKISLVVDCTTSVPPNEKIDKIKNTANYLSKKVGKEVNPVIFCSVEASMSKGEAVKKGVFIIDPQSMLVVPCHSKS